MAYRRVTPHVIEVFGDLPSAVVKSGQQYPYLVLDLPHDFNETTLAGLDKAHEILTVMSPELASVRAMVCTLGVFESLMNPPEIIRLVLNCTFQRHGLALKDN